MAPKTKAEARDLLVLRIAQSDLKAGGFARSVLKRDPRIVRRWLDMTQTIPQVVVDFLEQPEPSWPQEVDGNK